MAVTSIDVQDFSNPIDGEIAFGVVDPTTEAADDVNGNDFTNDNRTWLFVENTSGGPIDVTIAAERECDFGVTHDLVVTVPDGTDGRLVGPFRHSRFSADSQRVTLSYSAAGLNVAAVRL